MKEIFLILKQYDYLILRKLSTFVPYPKKMQHNKVKTTKPHKEKQGRIIAPSPA